MARFLPADRDVVGEPLVRAGLFAFAFAVAVPFVGGAPRARGDHVSVAPAFQTAGVAAAARGGERARLQPLSEVVAGVETTPEPTPEPTPAPTPRAVPRTPAPQPVVVAAVAEVPAGTTVVLASWYGPGFYGNRTACGLTYTPEILGVAHLTLPCGTMLTLTYANRSVTVPVIDRGPYIAGRTLDLSNATRVALGCPDLCTLSMRVVR